MNHSAAPSRPSIAPYGESAVRVAWEASIRPDIQLRVRALSAALEDRPFPGMVECVPAYAAVTVFYDPFETGNARKRGEFGEMRRSAEEPAYRTVSDLLERLIDDLDLSAGEEPRIVDVPVCYGGEYGPDLEEVARHAGLPPEKVVDIHAEGEYLVYMIGFAPGFPYLGGMSESIAAPRRQTPRSAIPAGSVGIAGKQTGVYPLSTPGGWQLIGRTPLALFRPEEDPPSLLRAGDRIRFRPIGQEEFRRLEAGGSSAAEPEAADAPHKEERL